MVKLRHVNKLNTCGLSVQKVLFPICANVDVKWSNKSLDMLNLFTLHLKDTSHYIIVECVRVLSSFNGFIFRFFF